MSMIWQWIRQARAAGEKLEESTRQWRSCRGQIKVFLYEEKRKLHIEKFLITIIKLYNKTKLNMCNK